MSKWNLMTDKIPVISGYVSNYTSNYMLQNLAKMKWITDTFGIVYIYSYMYVTWHSMKM